MKTIYKLPSKILYYTGTFITLCGIGLFVFGHMIADFARDKEKKA